MNSTRVLFLIASLLALVTVAMATSTFINAMQIEFKRSSYSDSSYSYYTLYARISTTWQLVCYDTNLGTTDARALCSMMGYSSSNAAMSYSYSSRTSIYGVAGLKCDTQSGNSTNFNQCSYTSSYAPCIYGSYYRSMTLRCGGMTTDGGSHGIFIDGNPDVFIRRRWNNQLQARQVFSATWKNVAATSTSSFDYNAVSNLCYWTSGSSVSSTNWAYVSSASPALDSENGFAFKDVTCKSASTSSSYSLSSCSYSTASLPSISTSKPVALTCSLNSNDKGVLIGNGNYLRLVGSSSYKNLEIYNSNAFPSSVYSQRICTTSTSSSYILDTNTRAAFCRWAGYGSDAYGYTSSTTSSVGLSAIWNGVSCPAGAANIDQCSISPASIGQTCTRTITLRCYQGSSSPSSSSGKNNNDSSGFPVASIIVPIVWIVIVVGFFMYRRSRAQSMAATSSSYNSSNNLTQVMGSTSNNNNNNNNNYHNFNHTSSPSSPSSPPPPPPMMMSGQSNNIQFAPVVGGSPHQQNYNYQQPDENFVGGMPPPPSNFAAGPPPGGMTTFDNVYQGGQGDSVPPPPGGYSFMPGFDPNQQGGGNYPPPPPPGGY